MIFDKILDMSSPTFAEDLRIALDLTEGSTLEIATPQFERTDGRIVSYRPNTAEEYDAIKNLSDENLRKIGCGCWGEENGMMVWLYPKEWYGHIPAGYLVTDINGETEPFVPGETDDDIRFGLLAYGFSKPIDGRKE